MSRVKVESRSEVDAIDMFEIWASARYRMQVQPGQARFMRGVAPSICQFGPKFRVCNGNSNCSLSTALPSARIFLVHQSLNIITSRILKDLR